MITKITGESPFQVMAETFCISPSNEGYTIQFSADGTSYTDLIAVEAGVNKTVSEQAVGTYYKLVGNASEITVTSGMDCNTGGGGGGSYTLPKASSTTLGGVKIGDGISIDTDGKISASGGGGSLSYKYIIPESGKVSDEFLAALQACGYDGVKLNELGRSVALQVALRNEGEYNYFPATEVHRYTKDSGWESDRVVFVCVGMGFDAVGLVKYPIVMVEGDNAGEVGAYIGDFKMASVSIPTYIQMDVAADGSITFVEGGGYQLRLLLQYNRFDLFTLVDMPLIHQVDGNVLSEGTITRSKKIDDSTCQFTGEIEINDVVYTGVWNVTDNGVEVVSFTAKA